MAISISLEPKLVYRDSNMNARRRSNFDAWTISDAEGVIHKDFYPTTTGTTIHEASTGLLGNNIDLLILINRSDQTVKINFVRGAGGSFESNIYIPSGSLLMTPDIDSTENITLTAQSSNYPHCELILASHYT